MEGAQGQSKMLYASHKPWEIHEWSRTHNQHPTPTER